MIIKGIDVSYCQKGFDYKEAKAAGVKFAIIRAGFSQTEDSQLRYHISECEKYGIAYGFYWYSYAMSIEDANNEAAACLKTLSGLKPAYPVFFDMEESKQSNGLSRSTITDIAIEFCTAIEKGGFPCGIYANPSWLENCYDKSRIVGKYDIWLAHWTNSPNNPSKYDYNQTMWQWGIDKIGMDVDGNLCFIDYPEKVKKWYAEHGVTQGASKQPKPLDKTDLGAQDDDITPDLRKGDKVTLSKAPLYISSTAAKKSTTISGTYYIHSDGIINSRIRITTPKGCVDCTGWVNAADCKTDKPAAPAKTATLKVGDKVRVRSGALTYSGERLASWVYSTVYDVQQVGTDKASDYIVIGVNGQVTAGMRAEDLIKV